MKRSMRLAGVVLVILLGALATYQLAYQSKIEALDKYMVLLGNRLLSVVPEGAGKEALANYYQDFVNRVKSREIEPERVERVAAVILNAVNSRQTISPQQAQSLIKVAAFHSRPDTMEAVYPHPELPKPAPPRQWEALGERLKSVYEFNEELLKTARHFASEQSQIVNHIQYQVEDGLKVIVNARVEAELSGEELDRFSAELSQLEKQNLIIWQENFKEQMELQMKQVQEQLARVQSELENQDQFAGTQQKVVIDISRTIKSLDSLQIPIPVNVDSIMIEVRKELNELKKEKN